MTNHSPPPPPVAQIDYWLSGARVWAMWYLTCPQFELYTFIGMDGVGLCYFQNRKTGARMAMTLLQIAANKAFRPFLINNDRIDTTHYVTSRRR